MTSDRKNQIERAACLRFGVGAYVGAAIELAGTWRVEVFSGAGRALDWAEARSRDGAFEALFRRLRAGCEAPVTRIPRRRDDTAGEHYAMAREQLRRARYCFQVAIDRREVGDAFGSVNAYDAAILWLLGAAKDRRLARGARRLRCSPDGRGPDCAGQSAVATLALMPTILLALMLSLALAMGCSSPDPESSSSDASIDATDTVQTSASPPAGDAGVDATTSCPLAEASVPVCPSCPVADAGAPTTCPTCPVCELDATTPTGLGRPPYFWRDSGIHINYLAAGDSITAGAELIPGNGSPQPGLAYPALAGRIMGSKITVSNIGQLGWTTQQMLDAAVGEGGTLEIWKRGTPGNTINIVSLMGGDNDIHYDASAGEIEGRIHEFVHQAHERGWLVIVCTIPPVNYPNWTPWQTADVDEWILDGGSGADGVCDFNDPIMKELAPLNDVHPTVDGHVWMAGRLVEGMAPVLIDAGAR